MSDMWARRRLPSVVALLFLIVGVFAQADNDPTGVEAAHSTPPTPLSIGDLAADFVRRTMVDLPVASHLQVFRDYDPDALARELDSDHKRLAFWINIYNGYTQHFLKSDPTPYLRDRGSFFKKRQIAIAGYAVSMEDIEHGVLRRGATIWSLGHFRSLRFRNAFVQRFAVDSVDYRIHFALNCGARSCPPVTPYYPAMVDAQLDESTADYLRRWARYDAESNTVRLPRLMLWFSADFGDRAEKRAILSAHGVLAENTRPGLEYLPYDWTMQIENYRKPAK